MENFIKLIEESFNDDFKYDFENYRDILDKEFFTVYLINAHLVYNMKRIIEDSRGDLIYDDNYILKFDTLVSYILENFCELYYRVQIISKEFINEFDEEQKQLKEIVENLGVIDIESIYRVFINNKNKYLQYTDGLSVSKMFMTNTEKFKMVKKGYYILKEAFSMFEFRFVMGLKSLSDFRGVSLLNNSVETIVFYLCLTKKTFIGFFDDIKNELEKEILHMIKDVYRKNNACDEFKRLRGYINEHHKGKYGEKKGAGKCFAILNVNSSNIFSLSGDDRNFKSGYKKIADEINEKVFNNKYIYAHLLPNTKRYVCIEMLGNVYEELATPISLCKDDKINRTNSDIGSVYGCCERKMIAWCEKYSLINSDRDRLMFYIKYLPCAKCQPAIQNYDSQIYALYLNYDDMVNQLFSNKCLEIRKANKVNRYIFMKK